MPTRSRALPTSSLRGTLAALLAALALASGAPAQETGDRDDGDYGIQPGDQVRMLVFTAAGEPLEQVGGERLVDRRGRLFLPLVGTLQVEGMNASEIRDMLVQRFSEFFDQPVVDLTVRLKVNVTGAVRSPGHYFVDPSATLVDVLANAGGTASEAGFGASGWAADASRIRVVRGNEQIVLDLRPEQADEEAVRFQVQSGDWIYVPPRTRSRIRDNLSFASSILTVVGSTVGLILLFTR